MEETRQSAASAPAAAAPAPRGAVARWASTLRAHGAGRFVPIWAVTVLLFAVTPVIAPGTMGIGDLQTMLPFAAILAIAAVGQTLVVQQGGLDLSVPGTISLGAALVTKVPAGSDGRLIPALLVVAAAAVAVGLVIGTAVTRFGITPLVATLGVNVIVIGTVVQITGGSIASTVPGNLATFAGDRVAGVPTLALVAVAVVGLAALVVGRTVGGRRFELVGASAAAARVAGIRVRRYQVGTYVAASLCYAAAGVLLAGLTSAPTLFAGDPYLLPTIAAVVLGGTSLAGGRGSVVASAVGALFLTQLDRLVLSTGAEQAVQSLIQAAIVALGMGLRNVPWARLRAGSRGAGPALLPAAPASPSPRPELDRHVEPTRGT
jgi:ribose transport system permease protein